MQDSASSSRRAGQAGEAAAELASCWSGSRLPVKRRVSNGGGRGDKGGGARRPSPFLLRPGRFSLTQGWSSAGQGGDLALAGGLTRS